MMGKGARNRAAHALTREQAIALLSQPDVRKEFDRQIGLELQKRSEEFYEREIAVILWVLRDTFGFGKVRLRRFYVNYDKAVRKLVKWYGEDYKNTAYLAEELLKRDGINFREWEDEDENHAD